MKRYKLDVVENSDDGYTVWLVENKDGQYVKYKDVAQLISDVRVLQAECDAIRAYFKVKPELRFDAMIQAVGQTKQPTHPAR